MSTKKITILKRDYSKHCSTNTPVPLCSRNMETDDSSKNKSQELKEDPAQLGPSQGSRCAPSQLELRLQKVLTQEKEQNQGLASQNAAVKEQMGAKKVSWEKEKKKTTKAPESAGASQNQAHVGRNNFIKDQQIRSLQKALREQGMETKRVIQYWKEEYDQVTAFWKRENRKITVNCENEIKAIKAASYKDLLAMSAEWEQRWHVQQEEVFTQMEALREEMDKKVNQVILEKDDLITKITNEKKVLEAQCAESSAKLREKELGVNLEFMDSQAEWNSKHQSLQEINSNLAAELKETSAKLKEKEQEFINSQAEWNRTMDQFVLENNELITFTSDQQDILEAELKKTSAKLEDKVTEITQREAEWQAKCKALEDQLKCEVAEKEASFKRMQELEREGRKEEEEWLHKATQMEENIKLLTQRNNELQELALMTDKEKAKIKKEAKKAKKEAEKKLKKERKEREEREKKERKEHEKKERERLEREKKEQKLREEKEKEKKKAKRWLRGD